MSKYIFDFLSTYFNWSRSVSLQVTFSGLAKVAIFTTNVDAENQILINHKCVCGALSRHFCQTLVICRYSVNLTSLFRSNLSSILYSNALIILSFSMLKNRTPKSLSLTQGIFLSLFSY